MAGRRPTHCFDQRGFASSIVAEQAVHFASVNSKLTPAKAITIP
jgi:hypothetical protein